MTICRSMLACPEDVPVKVGRKVGGCWGRREAVVV